MAVEHDGPRGTVTTFSYNRYGGVGEIDPFANSALTDTYGNAYTAQYDPNGRLTTLQQGNNVERKTTFDALGRAITVIELSAGSPILTFIDTYDPAGRKVGNVNNGVQTTYTYDAIPRLTGQQQAGGYATFTMDSLGNIGLKWYQANAPLSMTFDAASRLVTMLDGNSMTTYTFDPAGNKTVENLLGVLTSYTYDGENRLVGILNPDGTLSTYTYQGDGPRRTAQQPGENVSTMVWDGKDYLGQF